MPRKSGGTDIPLPFSEGETIWLAMFAYSKGDVMKNLSMLPVAGMLSFALTQDVGLPPVEDLMTPEVMQITGLSKLSSEELAYLNSWLLIYARSVVEMYGTAAETANNPGFSSSSTADVIESRIDGTFEGWDGDTVFRLMNGQVWQQAQYDYHYHYAYMVNSRFG